MMSEKQLAYSRRYEHEHRTERREKSRRYNAAHPGNSTRAVQRLRETNPARAAFLEYGRSARAKKRAWTLPEALAKDLFTDNCFFCGKPPAPINGIDRVDNARGYEEDNVVTACRRCNLAKNTQTLAEFDSWVAQVYNWRLSNPATTEVAQ